MCGEIIGNEESIRSHRLARKDQGARRIMSPKLVDKSIYYVWSLTKMEEFWEGQRHYITAEINRIRKNDIVKSKVIQNQNIVG